MSGPCKHRWIVLIEFDRPPRETSGFNSFLRGIGAPAERFPLSIATSAERARCGEFGIDTTGNFRELEGFNSLFTGAPIKAGERAKIVVVGLKASGRFALCALNLGALQLRSDCANHAARHLILQIENIFKQAVEPIRPEMHSCCGIDELSSDANTIGGLSDAALEHVSNAKFTSDLLDIDGFALVREGGLSRDDEHGFLNATVP